MFLSDLGDVCDSKSLGSFSGSAAVFGRGVGAIEAILAHCMRQSRRVHSAATRLGVVSPVVDSIELGRVRRSYNFRIRLWLL